MAKRIGVLLTKRSVDAAAKKDKRYYVWDSALPGFGVRIETSGAKTFIVRYRAEGGGRTAAQRFITVGRYGTLIAEAARKQAKMLLGGVAKGEDPADERRAKRAEMRISSVETVPNLGGPRSHWPERSGGGHGNRHGSGPRWVTGFVLPTGLGRPHSRFFHVPQASRSWSHRITESLPQFLDGLERPDQALRDASFASSPKVSFERSQASLRLWRFRHWSGIWLPQYADVPRVLVPRQDLRRAHRGD
jgi:hypothetical protein